MGIERYGLLLGRFQPFHVGHSAIIDEIVADGLEPLVAFGSSNLHKRDSRNPFTDHQRRSMVLKVLPEVDHVFVKDDAVDWDAWYKGLTMSLGVEGVFAEECVFYINQKPLDKIHEFTFRGKKYTNAYYSDIYSDLGLTVKHQTYSHLRGLKDLNASTIREDIEKHKHFLHGDVYKYIRGLKL